MAEGNMSETKEKILFETKDMVFSLHTQVAVLIATQAELVKKIDGYMERSQQQYDRMDVRVTNQGTDITTLQERVNTHRTEINELKKKSNFMDFIGYVFTALVAAAAYFFGR